MRKLLPSLSVTLVIAFLLATIAGSASAHVAGNGGLDHAFWDPAELSAAQPGIDGSQSLRVDYQPRP
jgi:hypothetical protein